jgi:transposase
MAQPPLRGPRASDRGHELVADHGLHHRSPNRSSRRHGLICNGALRQFGSEKSYAALCGSSPVEISSGRTNRHRLNRAGDRQANSAPWIIAMVRIRSRHAPTVAYIERRTAEGLSKRDIIRCLKRYIARETYGDISRIMRTRGSDTTTVIAA